MRRNKAIRRTDPAAGVPRAGVEWLIAVGRLFLATVALVTLALDPTTPAAHPRATFFLLAAFLGYALLLLLLAWLREGLLLRIRWVSHAIDLSVFAALMYSSEGPNSPVFLFFSLSLVSAVLRWQWRGVLWTAVVLLVVYDASGAYSALVLHSPLFELDRFVIRTIYLGVLAAALAYLGWYEVRLRSEMATLAAWSAVPGPRRSETLASLLREAADIAGARIAILLWEDPVEPWSRIDVWDGHRFESDRLPPAQAGFAVASPFGEHDFITRPAPTADTWIVDGDEVRRVTGTAVGEPVQALTQGEPVLGVAIRGVRARGRLFLAGRAIADPATLVAGRLIAQRTAAVLDYMLLRRRLRAAAARRERLLLSRDLHDGLLQSLTGAALQLQAIESSWVRDPAGAQERLQRVQRFIAAEQKQLRLLIETLRPEPARRSKNAGLAAELDDLCRGFGAVWELDVALDVADDFTSPRRLTRHVYSIVREALANAVRHGRATSATVRLRGSATAIALTIADNGAGFDFHGRWNLDELRALNAGPASLMNRVAALGGRLVLESSPGGARLEIDLPMEAHGTRSADPHRPGG